MFKNLTIDLYLPMKCVSISLIIYRNEIHHEHILCYWIQTIQSDLECREHSSVIRHQFIFTEFTYTFYTHIFCLCILLYKDFKDFELLLSIMIQWENSDTLVHVSEVK